MRQCCGRQALHFLQSEAGSDRPRASSWRPRRGIDDEPGEVAELLGLPGGGEAAEVAPPAPRSAASSATDTISSATSTSISVKPPRRDAPVSREAGCR